VQSATAHPSKPLIRLTRDQQANFVVTAPETFAPAADGWGKWGSTIVRLEAADEATLWDALATAWRNVTGVPIDPFKVADADNLNETVDNTAGIDAKVTDIDAADVAVADVSHVVAADVANGPGINVAASAKVELNDDLQNVIQRLQVYWADCGRPAGPARHSPQGQTCNPNRDESDETV